VYSIELKAYFFKGFKNFTAFSFNNIVILLNFTLKTILITKKVPIFINYLKKRRLLFFQIRVHGKNNLFYFEIIIKDNERKSRNNGHFKSIYNKLLFRVSGKSDFFSH
jgi:hypothetical protein